MALSEFAGKPVPQELIINVPRLMAAYYAGRPDPLLKSQQVSFGTSGHRGCSLDRTFNERHILAIAQAICIVFSPKIRICKTYRSIAQNN